MANGDVKSKPVLGYHDIRGLAEPIRTLLHYCDVQFEDKRYRGGGPPDFDRSEWLNDKFQLGLDFPNLPYYIDGDMKVSQSNAILRFVARRYDASLLGETEREQMYVDIMENMLMDFRNTWVRLCYGPFEEQKDKYIKDVLPLFCQGFSNILKKNGNKWLVGDRLTFVDFVMFELLDQHKQLVSDFMKDYTNLEEFCKRFEKLPEVKAYRESKAFEATPINNTQAKFGFEKIAK